MTGTKEICHDNFLIAVWRALEQKEAKRVLIATVKKHGGNKQNEDWHGSERRGRFAAFPARFSSRKSFYDLRLDLRFVWYNGCELNDMYQTH